MLYFDSYRFVNPFKVLISWRDDVVDKSISNIEYTRDYIEHELYYEDSLAMIIKFPVYYLWLFLVIVAHIVFLLLSLIPLALFFLGNIVVSLYSLLSCVRFLNL